MGKRIDTLVMDMYEEPCVDMYFLTEHKLLRPRQLESLWRLDKQEDKQTKSAGYDDWVVTSGHAADTTKPGPSKNNKRCSDNNNLNKKPGTPSIRAQRNPNHPVEALENHINAVEIWLNDAIEYTNRQDIISAFAEEMKNHIPEQQHGLVYGDDPIENNVQEEEEAQELVKNFREGLDLQGYESRFINIGTSYKTSSFHDASATDPFFGNSVSMFGQVIVSSNTNKRKAIDYNRSNPPSIISSSSSRRSNNNFSAKETPAVRFDFFGDDPHPNMMRSNPIDHADEELQQDEDEHEALERWMKTDDVTLWPLAVRLKAHKRWAAIRNRTIEQEIQAIILQYNQVSAEIHKQSILNDAKLCRANRVVGMTSMAASKYHDLLEEIKPTIVVVEEAAEMLESQIFTAFVPSLQHLVLIGDHQQVRPSTAVRALSEQHHLSVSLFERLVKNELPYTRLSHQRRMRPEIRTLIKPIYSNPPLQDHPSVYHPPNVRGMQRNVFFLAHEQPEDHVAGTQSAYNLYEARMAARLGYHLLLQGYNPKDITIVTMCNLAMIPWPFMSAVWPDYKGKENKIIILSLVRSNHQGQIGALDVGNHVCVGLSRVKHGMYILGNAEFLCDKSNLWNEIVSDMKDGTNDVIGTTLGLHCDTHNVTTQVQWPEDFTEVKEGGCSKLCGAILNCGHQCPLRCHSYGHDKVQCIENCYNVITLPLI
ncbi:hypothetical protein [Absidia glauca]|uniref:DNA2/NAM7 helicase-like C-terminal domain-containing protein n=1 Tax=Absidia glauca TaxID=4829 RepID=A0A168PE63_ABSGL|nr:hypothetical protein [Absidia glauca]